MVREPYHVARSGRGYCVQPAYGSGASVLGHEPMEKAHAEFLCAHMNHAFGIGWALGDGERLSLVRLALGLR